MKNLSASSVKKWRHCKRQWAWEYKHGHRPESKGFNELGTEVHAMAENWLRSGEMPDYSKRVEARGKEISPAKIFEAGVKLLPPPKTGGLALEDKIEFTSPSGGWVGCVDLHYMGEDGVPVVTDFKTTAGERWALTPDTLLGDIQALLYGAWAAKHYGTKKVQLRWIYFLTSGSKPRAWAVEATLDLTDSGTLALLDGIDMDALAMWGFYRDETLTALDLDPTVSSCAAFGGCPHVNRCNLTPAENLLGWFKKGEERKMVDPKILAVTELLRPAPPPPPPPPVQAAPPPPPVRAAINPPPPPVQAAINPPEAPNPHTPTPIGEAPPVDKIEIPAEGLDGLDRKALKALAIERGLADSSYRGGKSALIELLSGARPRDTADLQARLRKASEILRQVADEMDEWNL